MMLARNPLILVFAIGVVLTQGVSADATEGKSLITELNTALLGDKPIFDCFGLGTRIKRAWNPRCRPCAQDNGGRAKISFQIDANGKAQALKILKSSGIALCDERDKNAIEKAELFYIPTDDAQLVYDFSYVSADGHLDPDGPRLSILLPIEKREARAAFVVHSGSFHQEHNNAGVVQFLNGDFLAAEHSFEESLKCDSTYPCAVHNLKLVRKLLKLPSG